VAKPRKKKRGRKKRKRNGGCFRPGSDPRRHLLTREECQRGFQAACAKGWEIAAWLHKKLKLYYSEDRKRAKAEERRCCWERSVDDRDVRDAARNGTGHQRNGDHDGRATPRGPGDAGVDGGGGGIQGADGDIPF
jgi:hypothetical protein